MEKLEQNVICKYAASCITCRVPNDDVVSKICSSSKYFFHGFQLFSTILKALFVRSTSCLLHWFVFYLENSSSTILWRNKVGTKPTYEEFAYIQYKLCYHIYIIHVIIILCIMIFQL